MGRHDFDPEHAPHEHRSITTRRTTLGIALSGLLVGLGLLPAEARKKRKKCKKRKSQQTGPNDASKVCADRNWCLDRSQTCGPAGGYGKCLVEATGGNICGEILFQTASCADCEAPSCTDCRCVLAAGGGDRCNNGVNGQDFICVRPV